MQTRSEQQGAGATAPAEPTPAGEEAGGDHENANYLGVWGGLAALTLLEVWVASLGFGRAALITILVGLAVWKALLVALYYMHLKFEPRRLLILAVAPLPLAVILVLAVMQEF